METLETWGISDCGLVRQNNEDAWLIDPSLGLAIVADGMGGASCGEVAAAIAVEAVVEYVRSLAAHSAPEEVLEQAVRLANHRVFQHAQTREGCQGMGTTIVAALWRLPRVCIANVGDSRAYLCRGRQLIQLSYDQTLVNELRVKFGLTAEEVSNFPHKNVLTMAVGTGPEVTVRTHTENLMPGDQILLCSDGLSGPVPEEEIASIMASAEPLPVKAERLVEAARAHGAPDNVTAVLLRYE
ncbi:MAG: Stp1/IreP family PP2C-type Ser/Thr phosphatase [Bryobacterales bacterium]|nr:Stp1/IreP family PP2C-type Ser/Thr phosphatase [Bryobacteraceae bacterium]MDW8131079.1 Stp1/IreP family PP2C-type Ser/Thr phosphatase [Bryobacterales bacterium]